MRQGIRLMLGVLLFATVLGVPSANADTQSDQLTPTTMDVTSDGGYVVDGCRYNVQWTQVARDIFGWWLFKYTGTANWCYDGFGVTSHSFSTSWDGRWGWEMTSQSVPAPIHSSGSENGHYFWWSRIGTGHFKVSQYGYSDTGDLWVKQVIHGNSAIDQSGGGS
jgi:hypothetical protein